MNAYVATAADRALSEAALYDLVNEMEAAGMFWDDEDSEGADYIRHAWFIFYP